MNPQNTNTSTESAKNTYSVKINPTTGLVEADFMPFETWLKLNFGSDYQIELETEVTPDESSWWLDSD